MANVLNQPAYMAAVRPGDIPVDTTSARMALDPVYKTVRLSPDDDVYVQFGDNTVAAVVGQGLKIRGGSIESLQVLYSWTHMAYVAASATNMNVAYGEGE